ncbi:TOBE domain-containing protein [Spongiimicrobium salis]|uniref:TOBE domain-containing protein n=1 Tax=Spongiimicrobium salis TaxID=1667022 RepID=UPI00374CECAE
MNSLSGHITTIEVHGGLSLVSLKIGTSVFLKTIIVETPKTAPYLVKGHPIRAIFKETEVVLGAAEPLAISLQNRIQGTIKKLDKGVLISKVTINSSVGELVSIVSTAAITQLKLTVGLPVVAMIKLNEIMLSEQ